VSTPNPDDQVANGSPGALDGRAVLVTGGSSGLGAAVARRVADAGATPVVLDRRRAEAPWQTIEVDLADAEATFEAVEEALRIDRPLAGVVTCAGIDHPAPFTELPFDRWEEVLRVNLLGTAAVARASLARLEADRGRLVTVASTLGHRTAGDASAYCASKWGVVGFSRALTEELKGRVSVTMLTPGGMNTAFFDGRTAQYKPGPDAGLCDPADVADTVVFALSRPPGCDIKELVVAGPTESSWP
jgi:NAD(P)-dependent dehydrogenase (short-subunit alcohol dehydrogenase family)